MRHILVACALLALASSSGATVARAEQCQHCGCHKHCRKICRCVPETKEEIEVCWDVKCEDFCVPGPSCKLCTKCERDKCGCWTYDLWKPQCAQVRTRRVPVKTEVVRKVPTHKWVVETVCDQCRAKCQKHDPQPPRDEPGPEEQDAAPVPPAPAPKTADAPKRSFLTSLFQK